MNTSVFGAIVNPLLMWYDHSARSLPWRDSKDPYLIWVSEIMLQQTRVAAVRPYFLRFTEVLPTVFDLAAAPEAVILKLWEGLGYYTRVRNMQKAAKIIAAEHGGGFPQTAAALRQLPGIGDYTAGAIASIAFGARQPAVDGNVLRLAARLLASEQNVVSAPFKQAVTEGLLAVYPAARSGDFTQALMELGALICLPGRAPHCDECPLRALCAGYAKGIAAALPVKPPRRPKKTERKTVFVLRHGDTFALQFREQKDVLRGFYAFPTGEDAMDAAAAARYVQSLGIACHDLAPFISARHVFTHKIWEMQSYYGQCDAPAAGFIWKTLAEITADISIPSAFKPFLREILRRHSAQEYV